MYKDTNIYTGANQHQDVHALTEWLNQDHRGKSNLTRASSKLDAQISKVKTAYYESNEPVVEAHREQMWNRISVKRAAALESYPEYNDELALWATDFAEEFLDEVSTELIPESDNGNTESLSTNSVYKHVQSEVFEKFGIEEGTRLLAANCIIPVDGKRPLCEWTKFRSEEFADLSSPPPGLALLCGQVSGYTVLDIDTKDAELHVPANVVTAKGFHYYCKWESHHRTINNSNEKFDLKANGYVVFSGAGKSFMHQNLYNLNQIFEVAFEAVPQPVEASVYRLSYIDKISNLGFEIDTEALLRRNAAQMRKEFEGSRKNTLFRLAVRHRELGLKTDVLADAAFEAGLSWYEIQYTLGRALATSLIISDVVDKSLDWHESAKNALRIEWRRQGKLYRKEQIEKDRYVLDQLRKAAIQQDTMKPVLPEFPVLNEPLANSIVKRISKLRRAKLDGRYIDLQIL